MNRWISMDSLTSLSFVEILPQTPTTPPSQDVNDSIEEVRTPIKSHESQIIVEPITPQKVSIIGLDENIIEEVSTPDSKSRSVRALTHSSGSTVLFTTPKKKRKQRGYYDESSEDSFPSPLKAGLSQNEYEIGEVLTPIKNDSDEDYETMNIMVQDTEIQPIDPNVIIRKKKKRSLVEMLKKAVTMHVSSVKIWPSRLHRNQIPESDVEYLQVVKYDKVVGVSSVNIMIITLCVDIRILLNTKYIESNKTINSKYDDYPGLLHWIILKLNSSNQITVGGYLKLYPPWQRIFVPKLGDEVTICTDFYKVTTDTEVGVTGSIMKEYWELLKDLVEAKIEKFKEYVPKNASFYDMVPYVLRNTRTIFRQMEKCATTLELDVIICAVWVNTSVHSWKALIKDGDNFFSLLEYSSVTTEILPTLTIGQRCRFKGLLILQKITTSMFLQLISIIAATGHQQCDYYRLLISDDTELTIMSPSDIDIDFEGFKDLKTHTIDEMSNISSSTDCRITVEGTLTRISHSEVLFDDNFGKRMRIRVLSAGSQLLLQVNLSQPVKIQFLRFYRGIATIDEFSSVEQCDFDVIV